MTLHFRSSRIVIMLVTAVRSLLTRRTILKNGRYCCGDRHHSRKGAAADLNQIDDELLMHDLRRTAGPYAEQIFKVVLTSARS